MRLFHSDCLSALRELPDGSLDSLVTDPPAGISMMNAAWDSDKGGRAQWVAWMTEVMRECLRVLKPGAHGLVWALPRTAHWTATALENAGFEVLNKVYHLFGTGFPKSHDISKAIDKAAGAGRTEKVPNPKFSAGRSVGFKESPMGEDWNSGLKPQPEHLTLPATDAARQWQGWGTALKPAVEEWILVRKPLGEKTIAANVLKHGTGGINVDGCRVGYGPSGPDRPLEQVVTTEAAHWGNSKADGIQKYKAEGRFPANLVLSHSPECSDACAEDCAVRMLDEQSGDRPSGGSTHKRSTGKKACYGQFTEGRNSSREADTGGASRFFYCAKASKSDRNRKVRRG